MDVEPIFENISPEEMAINAFPKPIPGDYSSLKNELLFKCNPSRFMQPYDHDKIDFANIIYPQILECKEDDIENLKELRLLAIDNLKVKFATKELYEYLCDRCNPSQYSSFENYDANMVKEANDLFQIIKRNADNIIILEDVYEKTKNGLWIEDRAKAKLNSKSTDFDTKDPVLIQCIVITIVIIVFYAIIIYVEYNK